jgi:small redox-active disulfide protein 2
LAYTIDGCSDVRGHRLEDNMIIQILGTGCARCKALTSNVERAVQELGVNAEIVKVTEIKEIMRFNVLMTPGLAIDGLVKAAGRVPSSDEIKELLVGSGEN